MQFSHQKARERAKESGISLRTQRKLDKLARLRPDLLAQVQAGELSVNRACIEAGYVEPLTPLQMLTRLWADTSEEERRQFLAFIQEWKPCVARRLWCAV